MALKYRISQMVWDREGNVDGTTVERDTKAEVMKEVEEMLDRRFIKIEIEEMKE